MSLKIFGLAGSNVKDILPTVGRAAEVTADAYRLLQDGKLLVTSDSAAAAASSAGELTEKGFLNTLDEISGYISGDDARTLEQLQLFGDLANLLKHTQLAADAYRLLQERRLLVTSDPAAAAASSAGEITEKSPLNTLGENSDYISGDDARILEQLQLFGGTQDNASAKIKKITDKLQKTHLKNLLKHAKLAADAYWLCQDGRLLVTSDPAAAAASSAGEITEKGSLNIPVEIRRYISGDAARTLEQLQLFGNTTGNASARMQKPVSRLQQTHLADLLKHAQRILAYTDQLSALTDFSAQIDIGELPMHPNLQAGIDAKKQKVNALAEKYRWLQKELATTQRELEKAEEELREIVGEIERKPDSVAFPLAQAAKEKSIAQKKGKIVELDQQLQNTDAEHAAKQKELADEIARVHQIQTETQRYPAEMNATLLGGLHELQVQMGQLQQQARLLMLHMPSELLAANAEVKDESVALVRQLNAFADADTAAEATATKTPPPVPSRMRPDVDEKTRFEIKIKKIHTEFMELLRKATKGSSRKFERKIEEKERELRQYCDAYEAEYPDSTFVVELPGNRLILDRYLNPTVAEEPAAESAAGAAGKAEAEAEGTGAGVVTDAAGIELPPPPGAAPEVDLGDIELPPEPGAPGSENYQIAFKQRINELVESIIAVNETIDTIQFQITRAQERAQQPAKATDAEQAILNAIGAAIAMPDLVEKQMITDAALIASDDADERRRLADENTELTRRIDEGQRALEAAAELIRAGETDIDLHPDILGAATTAVDLQQSLRERAQQLYLFSEYAKAYAAEYKGDDFIARNVPPFLIPEELREVPAGAGAGAADAGATAFKVPTRPSPVPPTDLASQEKKFDKFFEESRRMMEKSDAAAAASKAEAEAQQQADAELRDLTRSYDERESAILDKYSIRVPTTENVVAHLEDMIEQLDDLIEANQALPDLLHKAVEDIDDVKDIFIGRLQAQRDVYQADLEELAEIAEEREVALQRYHYTHRTPDAGR